MGLRNGPDSWGWPARLLHWGMAVLIVFMLALGLYASNAELSLARKFELVQLHKSVGATILALALLRLAWRGINPTPEQPAGTPAWQLRAARLSHATLYALMIALPFSGWLMASASPLNDASLGAARVPNMVWGLFDMPDPFPAGSEGLTDVFFALHVTLVTALCLVLLVHVGAALKHHFRDRDAVLRRMIVGR